MVKLISRGEKEGRKKLEEKNETDSYNRKIIPLSWP